MTTPTSSIPTMLSSMLISLLPSDFHKETIRDNGYDAILYGSPEEQFCDDLIHDDEAPLSEFFIQYGADDTVLDIIDEIFTPARPLLDTNILLHAYRERFDPTANHTIDMI